MKLWVRMALAFALLVGMAAPSTDAEASAPSPESLFPEYQHLPDYFVVGETYKLEVRHKHIGWAEVKKAEFAFSEGARESVEHVETEPTEDPAYYQTTGEFTPKKKGKYTLTFTITEEDGYNRWVDSVRADIRVIDAGLPEPPEEVQSRLTSSASTSEIGKEVKFTISTTKKGTKFDDAQIVVTKSPAGMGEVRKLKTVQRSGTYVTTGYFTPSQEGDYHFHFELPMSDENGKRWEGVLDFSIKVKAPKPKNIRVEMVPLVGKTQLQDGGQAVVIAKIPKSYAKKGYSFAWSDNVKPMSGPRLQDSSYEYVAGVFQAEAAGLHHVSFKAYREYEWVGEAYLQIQVDE